MPEQDLDNADVDAPFEQVRREAVPERVRPKLGVEAALVSRLVESVAGRFHGQMREDAAAGEQPLRAAVRLPDRAQHLEEGLGQGQNPFLVSLANQAEHPLFGVDGRDGQFNRLSDAQAVGIDQREAGAIDGFLECGDQAAAVVVAADVGEPLLAGTANFFLVNSAHSEPSVWT